MVEKSQAGSFWPTLFEPFRGFGARLPEWVAQAPAAEASADDQVYRIAVELPGVEEKDLDISVDDGVISVKGEKRTSREDKGDTWYFSERQYGSFSRSFRLPADADGAKIAAELKDGVLTLTAPKLGPDAKGTARKIAVGKAA